MTPTVNVGVISLCALRSRIRRATDYSLLGEWTPVMGIKLRKRVRVTPFIS